MTDTYIELPESGGSGATDVAELTPVTDGSLAGAGEIGEIFTSTVAASTGAGVGATGVFGSVTSLALGAGVWAITAVGAMSQNGATMSSPFVFGISDSATGVGIGQFAQSRYSFLITDDDVQFPTPEIIVSIAGATTYYLNSFFNYSAGSPEHYGQITARRIR